MLKGSDWSEGALMLVALVLAGCAVGRTSWRGDLKVWGDPTAICISAPCTQSMPCIGHFAEVGFLAGGCSTSRKLLHLSSPLFVWLKIGFCSFFQLIPPSPFERDFQRVPTPHLAPPIAVSPPLSRRGHRPCYRAQTLDRSYQFRRSKRHSLPKQSRKWGLQFPEDQ